ncbi:peptide deformylase [Ruminococcus sp. AF21-42]|nr:peptide deformylase [Ruminococcus sp. AF21-42]
MFASAIIKVRKGEEKMALRTIRVEGDPVLTKVSRPVDKMTPRNHELIMDMLDTMYDAMGVGLAAPQVGILKRIVVIDVGEGPIVLINPEILETSGEQTGDEGCLSVPGMAGQVTRPNYVKVKALDIDMNEVEYEGEGLLARAFCHEIDHLDGHMYTELVEGELHHVTYDEDEE